LERGISASSAAKSIWVFGASAKQLTPPKKITRDLSAVRQSS